VLTFEALATENQRASSSPDHFNDAAPVGPCEMARKAVLNPMSDATRIEARRMAKALSHPVRVQALEILNERVASPSDIARELDLPVANVSYHVSTLLKLKCIEEVETRPVRGALEHLYRAVRRPHATLADWESMPINARHAFAAEIGREAFDHFRAALESDSFGNRTDQHFTWTRLVLDERGWQNVYSRLHEVLDWLPEEQAASAARLMNGESGGPEIRAMVTMLQYESPSRDG
jgi:DNA-binding transcriptional ArsR family regulator